MIGKFKTDNPDQSYDQEDENDDGTGTYVDPSLFQKDLTSSLYHNKQQYNPNLYRSSKSKDDVTVNFIAKITPLVSKKSDKYEVFKAKKDNNSRKSSAQASFATEESKKNDINATIDSNSPALYK